MTEAGEGPAVEIVRVTRDNATVLDDVDEDVFDYAVTADYVRDFLSDPRSLLHVAVLEGRVIGMATGIVYAHPDKPLQLFVNEVGVAAAFHRRGIGTRLVRSILDHARSLGCAGAWVATEESNAGGRALYASTAGTEDPDRAIVYTWRFD